MTLRHSLRPRLWIIALAVLAPLAPLAVLAGDEPKPARQVPPGRQPRPDPLSIQWVRPFQQALDAAEARGRLLLIKPIAFGTTRDGCW
jgi:hypothetical protein